MYPSFFMCQMKLLPLPPTVMAVQHSEQRVVGLVEYPYSGSTWLRFLLAAAVGLPTCSEHHELQSSCEVLTNTFCPCTDEDLAHLSPRGWSTVKEAARKTCNSTPVTRPVEHVRGAQVQVWSGSEPVLVKKTHVRVRCHPLEHPVPASFIYDSFVWLIRHPVDVLTSTVRISQSEARSLGSRRVEKVNNFYLEHGAFEEVLLQSSYGSTI